jgi:hypothetical protein
MVPRNLFSAVLQNEGWQTQAVRTISPRVLQKKALLSSFEEWFEQETAVPPKGLKGVQNFQ